MRSALQPMLARIIMTSSPACQAVSPRQPLGVVFSKAICLPDKPAARAGGPGVVSSKANALPSKMAVHAGGVAGTCANAKVLRIKATISLAIGSDGVDQPLPVLALSWCGGRMSAKLLVTKGAAPQRCTQETTPVLLELASGISATPLRSAHSLTRFGPLKLGT